MNDIPLLKIFCAYKKSRHDTETVRVQNKRTKPVDYRSMHGPGDGRGFEQTKIAKG